MKLQSIETHQQNDVTMEGAEGVKIRMLIGPEDNAPNFHMRHFEVTPGGHTPNHHHDFEHEVLILKGEGIIKSEQGDRSFKTGDVIYVAPNENHQFTNPSPTPLEFICLVPATQQCCR